MIGRLFKIIKNKKQTFVDPLSGYINNLVSSINNDEIFKKDIHEATFCVIDTETTGLEIKTAKLINVAAVKVVDFKIKDFYNVFINPEMDIPEDSIQWHGITNEMVKDKPIIAEVLPEFLKFISDSVIVGHHVNFDLKMINKELQEAFNAEIKNIWIDTMLLFSKNILNRDELVSLDYLLRLYNVKCQGRHTALGDALATAEVFNKLVIKIKHKFQTVGDLYQSQFKVLSNQ
ncbi:3'-5' exonuclease [Deferribacter autotrophicus]|uniref:3'-5' exonuclease n=1 Tax=Deferribacter autotrophicus TaxID=500465 RepID=A0A5A8F7D5_9BACT|nr:3'-5' exonuclease [Deferribacter autotrophicus]KAA0258027.1 3'-5' exonuclease [Deferribacter autotrophicus]